MKRKRCESPEHIPEVYRLVLGAFGFGGVNPYLKSYYLEISSDKLESFRKMEMKKEDKDDDDDDDDDEDDFHGYHQLPYNPEFIAMTSWYVYGKPILVENTIYAMGTEIPNFSTKQRLDLITLNLNSNPKRWNKFNSRPPFELQTTEESVLVHLHDCLFVLGAYPVFGACFNFTTKLWSKLKNPRGLSLNSKDIRLIVSLGESVGKFLIFGFHHDDLEPLIHIYNPRYCSWKELPGESLACGLSNFYDIIDRPILVDDTIYFINESYMIYGFDSLTMTLFKGRVKGLSMLNQGYQHTAFMNFGGDLFCLCFYTNFRDPHTPGNNNWQSIFHFTFMRVIKDRTCNAFDAYVVGCFEHAFDGHYMPHGALFL